MEIIANRIVDYLDTDKTIWNDVDRMYSGSVVKTKI